jgi:hypothetical protein
VTRRRLIVVAALAASVAGCRDIPAPDGGVQSLSRVALPSPGLVVGDTMRDSLGNVAPLRVIAYDANGDTIASPAATFILFDTTASLDGDVLVGEHTGRARVIATVAGLQSRVDTVTVTLRPDTIVSDSTRYVRLVPVTTADTTFVSPDLAVIVQNREGTAASGVDAVVVTYTLTRSPPGHPSGTGPTVVFAGGTTTPVRDTTSGGGRAARAIRLREAALPQLQGTDSAMVTATASYRGQSLGTVTFTIVFQTQ